MSILEKESIRDELAEILFRTIPGDRKPTGFGTCSKLDGGVRYTVSCHERAPDGIQSTDYEIRVYAGTDCEKLLRLEVFEEIGYVDSDDRYRKPTYGFSIEVIEGRGVGCLSSGIPYFHEAILRGFARVAAYGNGGFPLDSLLQRK